MPKANLDLFRDYENPPPWTPSHPAFKGRCKVMAATAHISKDLDGPRYDVDLDNGTCTCQYGAAWEWHNKNQHWTPYNACSHKIRAMADIVRANNDDPDMVWAYTKEVARRYNMYEVVSAFHKELRRGNVEQAVFWGSILMTFRGLKGLYKYLLNILYEECRDHTLGEVILDRCIKPANQNYADICKLIKLFCETKKKWEMPHRYKFLEAEMQGYSRLVAKYGRNVAKASDIIDYKHKNVLLAALNDGIVNSDLATFQFGLKGLQKSKTANLDNLRADVCNRLAKLVPVKPKGYVELEAYIARRAANGFGVGYHELNALADLLTGEPYATGNTPKTRIAAVLAEPAPKLRLGVVPVIPAYAHDNHTWGGKALIKKYPHEYLPGANQEHMDLRMCGAYMGVTWRHLAFKQFQSIDVAWGSVEWPIWLAKTVQNLWY